MEFQRLFVCRGGRDVDGKFYESFYEIDQDNSNLKFDLISLVGVIELNDDDEIIDLTLNLS